MFRCRAGKRVKVIVSWFSICRIWTRYCLPVWVTTRHRKPSIRWEFLLISILATLAVFPPVCKSNEFVTVLPFSNLAETESILKEFIEDFQKSGISDEWDEAQKQATPDNCVDLAVMAGIAEGKPIAPIDSVIEIGKISTKRNWTAAVRRKGDRVK